MTHPYGNKRRQMLGECLKLPKMDPVTDPAALPMGEEVGFISQLALCCRKNVLPHELMWRELQVSTHLLKTRGVDPIEHEEDGYVGDFAFQPPHTYVAVNRGLGDPEIYRDLRTRPERQEYRCTRSTVSSGGWTNTEYHRDTDVQRVSDGRIFMFDDDAGQPDEHFCQGPQPPDMLPTVMLAGPPEASAEEAHSAPIASFPGELRGPAPSAPSQVTVDSTLLKVSMKSGLLQDSDGPTQVSSASQDVPGKEAKSSLRFKYYKSLKAKCVGALAKLLCARNVTRVLD